MNQIVPVEGHKHSYGPCSRVVLTCEEKSLEPSGGTSAEEDDFITSSDLDGEATETETTAEAQKSSATAEAKRNAVKNVASCINTAEKMNPAVILRPHISETSETPARDENRPASSIAGPSVRRLSPTRRSPRSPRTRPPSSQGSPGSPRRRSRPRRRPTRGPSSATRTSPRRRKPPPGLKDRRRQQSRHQSRHQPLHPGPAAAAAAG